VAGTTGSVVVDDGATVVVGAVVVGGAVVVVVGAVVVADSRTGVDVDAGAWLVTVVATGASAISICSSASAVVKRATPTAGKNTVANSAPKRLRRLRRAVSTCVCVYSARFPSAPAGPGRPGWPLLLRRAGTYDGRNRTATFATWL
jgi:hypothetical protein